MNKKDLPYKFKICKHCREIIMAKELNTNQDICVICGSKDVEERTLTMDTKLHCTYCKKEATVRDILKIWINIPFLNLFSMSYYDGCRGWD